MKHIIYKIVSLIIILFACQVRAQIVNNNTELQTAISSASAGSTIILANGTWTDVTINVNKTGTPGNPITIKAENPGQVFLEGKCNISLGGSYIVFEGFVFQNAANLISNNGTIEPIIEFRDTSNNECNNCKVTNIKIDSYNGTSAQSTDTFKWILVYGQYNEISNSSFIGKYGVGSIINDNRNDTNPDYTKIHHNYFASRTPVGVVNNLNDQDAIRIGNSSTSLSDSFTEVHDNLFYDWSGEVEIISNKSGKNKYYNNTFKDYQGTLTLRHGNDCEVYNNYFFADSNQFSGGIRVIGEDHKIYNNYIEGVNSEKPGGGTTKTAGAINITNGRPSSALNGYYQVKNATIVNNTFVNCDYGFRVGTNVGGDLTLAPENLIIGNNIMLNTSDNAVDEQTTPTGTSIYEGNITQNGSWDLTNGVNSNQTVASGLLASGTNFYELPSGSAAINAGVGSYSFLTNDILGGTRDANIDAGVEEYGATGTNLPYLASDVGTKIGFTPSSSPSSGTGEVIITEIYNRPQKPTEASELTTWLQANGYSYGDPEWDGGTPALASPDEGHTEWFEVYNTTNTTVDMTGWVLKDESNNNTHVMGSFTIGPGEYKVFAGMDYTPDIGYSIVDYKYGYKSLSFNNESSYDSAGDSSCPDGITIYKVDGTTLVDTVEYDYGYNVTSCVESQDTDHDFPAQGGNSKTSFMLNPSKLTAADNDDGANWSYATLEFDDGNSQDGTPGSENATTYPIITWDGSESADWHTPENWDLNYVPTNVSDVVIPTGTPNDPIISAGSLALARQMNTADILTINFGGTLLVGGTVTEDVTYKVSVDTDWHLICAPVRNEKYNSSWVTANDVATGTGNNIGISTYTNETPDVDTDGAGPDTATWHWRYYQDGSGDATFTHGHGFSMKRNNAGDYEFKGNYQGSDIDITITQDDNNWNLGGNIYASYMDIATLLSENSAVLESGFEAVYVWDGVSYVPLTTGYLHPGQGFFVSSGVATGTFSYVEEMQSYQSAGTFYRETPTQGITLRLSDGTSSTETQINYLEGKTTGIDARFDLGLFDGTQSDLRIFTHLVDNSDDIAFQIQTLPNRGLETMIVPVGVKAAANTEIAFSAEAMQLPTGIKVFIEDREANTFTQIDETDTNYSITLNEALDGEGRFYIHTNRNILNIDENLSLGSIHIFKSDASTLTIAGLPQGDARVTLYNVLGKQIMSTSFEGVNRLENISLPKLTTGIYIAEVQTIKGKTSKKIILE